MGELTLREAGTRSIDYCDPALDEQAEVGG
jgi:hypothetical protein